MEALLVKMSYRLPEYLARAAAQDPVAISILVAMGIGAGVKTIHDWKNKPKPDDERE